MSGTMGGMKRRGFLGILAGAIAAPAIIKTPGLLMPVRPLKLHCGGTVSDGYSVRFWPERGLIAYGKWDDVVGGQLENLERRGELVNPRTQIVWINGYETPMRPAESKIVWYRRGTRLQGFAA